MANQLLTGRIIASELLRRLVRELCRRGRGVAVPVSECCRLGHTVLLGADGWGTPQAVTIDKRSLATFSYTYGDAAGSLDGFADRYISPVACYVAEELCDGWKPAQTIIVAPPDMATSATSTSTSCICRDPHSGFSSAYWDSYDPATDSVLAAFVVFYAVIGAPKPTLISPWTAKRIQSLNQERQRVQQKLAELAPAA